MANRSSASTCDGQQNRAKHIRAVILVVFLLLGFRLYDLHVVKAKAWSGKEGVRPEKEVLVASRGTIVDRNGERLARNQTVYSIYFDPFHLRDSYIALRGLSHHEGTERAELRRIYSREQLQKRYQRYVAAVLHGPLEWKPRDLERQMTGRSLEPVILKRWIEEDEKRMLETVLRNAAIGGVYFRDESRRLYLNPNRLTHVLGYVGQNNSGLEGIEKTMDPVLKGQDGYRFVERDKRGREITAYRGQEIAPVNGRTVKLTIDLGLQDRVERVLESNVARYRPDKITVILMQPFDGKILALANRPHFDLNTLKGNRRNFALSDQYEPGSTFKVVAVGAALSQNLIQLSDSEYCHPGDPTAPDYLKDYAPFEFLTIPEVLAKSSNVGAYRIAQRLGPDGYSQAVRTFGFGRPTGVRLTGEVRGRVREITDPEIFSRLSIGYGAAVTPLQMLNALGGAINGGELLRPRIVESIENPDGTFTHFKREVIRRIITPEASADLRQALATVVSPNGTGRYAAVPGFEVGGKTGTARKHVEGKGYIDGKYVVSFMGFLPADQPQLMALVVVDSPKLSSGLPSGGSVAAPIFAEMMKEAVAYLDLKSDVPASNHSDDFLTHAR